ncbi:uroporphyrinogen-III synthase [Paeniglutamicibacter kerguelensis]|uniref:Uroporphyrinogen-III synthase n=1 Tax=Paeniglutamicibacter kerguelensis TaxID=254788 RepID=A0ABS4XGV2_9MICC|nr:uroporphyrinogen-III synthase [Paeniglutamicibacter kerguelensis]MBP2387709.1 uroporphyrinogen-III synthase [Paeniglutamicibacter kerguelensis]
MSVAELETPGRVASPLSGFRIAVTSERRSAELIEALQRRGAQVQHAPTLRMAPLVEDAELLEHTRLVLDLRPEFVLVSTAYGFRRWFETADAAGLGDELTQVLHDASIHVRGPKALGAVRALGFEADGMSSDELTSTLVSEVSPKVAGKRVVLQQHGIGDDPAAQALTDAGASEVIRISPYRWGPPEDADRMTQLLRALCSGAIDAVTFTSAPAVRAMLAAAEEQGCYTELLEALQFSVCCVTVGPVTAAPLREVGIEPLVPERHRMGAMIRILVEHLSDSGSISCQSVLGSCELRGDTVLLGGNDRELSAIQLKLFKAILSARGRVVPRARLVSLLPDGSSDHALDMALSRLRRALPDPRLISTVVKRGYRINV